LNDGQNSNVEQNSQGTRFEERVLFFEHAVREKGAAEERKIPAADKANGGRATAAGRKSDKPGVLFYQSAS
jgi:hypothetical protein